MGSEIIEAITVQKGNVETNPSEITPEVSRPITQTTLDFSTTSQPIQQRYRARTAPAGHDNLEGAYSKPILQRISLLFAPDFPDAESAHCLEQKNVVTGNHTKSLLIPKAATPIQQIEFLGDGQPIQQFIISTAGSTLSRPIHQLPTVQNTVQVTQFDFLDLVFPPCFSVKNPVNTNILWRIRDFGLPLDAETLIFTIQGIQVQDRPEFVVTSLANGLQLFYDPPDNFPYNEEVLVSLTIDDTAVPATTFYVACTWQTVPDGRPPFFRNITPACNSTDVDVLAPISFDVLDFGEGVDSSSIRLSVEGITVCSGVVLDAITDEDFVTVSGVSVATPVTGYHVVYEHPNDPWRYDSNVTIALEARDISPLQNRALFVCAFDTEESTEPLFINMLPEPCDTFVDNRTGLYFEVYGVEHGIDISTLEVRVDNKLRKVFVRPRILRTE